MRPRRLTIALCLVASLLFVGGGSSGATAADRQVWSPGSLPDALDSSIASDGKSLWLATMGQNRRGKVRTEVMVLSGKRWKRLGGKPRSVSGHELFLTLLPGRRTVPCLGDHLPASQAPRIRCFRKGEWRSVPYPARYRESDLGALVTRNGRLEASFIARGRSVVRPTFKLTQVRFGPGGARAIAPPIKLVGLWHGQPVAPTAGSTRGPLRLDLWDANSGRRIILTHSSHGWRRSAVYPGDGIEGSTRGSSSVLSGGSIVSPSTKVLTKEFYGGREETTMRFSLKKLGPSGWGPIGDGPLDVGKGYAQGGVFPVGDRIWAVWMEHDYEGVAFGGMLPTSYRAARLNASLTGFDREIELWSGETFFPGSLQAIRYRGKVAFLYVRQGRGGLQPTIDLR